MTGMQEQPIHARRGIPVSRTTMSLPALPHATATLIRTSHALAGHYDKHGDDEHSSASTSTLEFDVPSGAHETTSSPATPRAHASHKRSRGTALRGGNASCKRLGGSNPEAIGSDHAAGGSSSSLATASDPEEDSGSMLDDVFRQLASNTLELTANDRMQLERSARSAMRTLLQWIDSATRYRGRWQPCCHRWGTPCNTPGPSSHRSQHTDTIRLQLLAARMQLLWSSYHNDGHLDAVQMLTVLFLLVIRSAVFRDVPVEPWDSVDLVRGDFGQSSRMLDDGGLGKFVFTRMYVTRAYYVTGWLPVTPAIVVIPACHHAAPSDPPLLLRAAPCTDAVPRNTGALSNANSGPVSLQQ